MSRSYKTMLSIIFILIICCVALGVTYLFYDKEASDSTIVLVDGNLSINFLDGNIIQKQKENEYSLLFSVTNNSNDVASYSINFNDVKNNSKEVLVSIENTVSNSVINEMNLPKEDKVFVEAVQIASGETHNYKINVKSENEDMFEAIIKIIEEKPEIETFAQTILANNTVSDTTLTKVGEEEAIEDEGLISDIDDSGSTYYFRGATTNNYVLFANLIWRIVKINGDGTVKLILNSEVDTVQAFYANAEGEFNAYKGSAIESYLLNWYEFNIQEYDDYVNIDKFCNDYNKTNESEYTSYIRNITNKIPTFNCLGQNVGTKIGLLTADEAIYAGALYQTNNTAFYLYNSKNTNAWWTMTPASGTETSMNPFIINESGALDSNVSGNLNRGVRPVINLIKDISVNGAGTENDPYVVKLDK